MTMQSKQPLTPALSINCASKHGAPTELGRGSRSAVAIDMALLLSSPNRFMAAIHGRSETKVSTNLVAQISDLLYREASSLQQLQQIGLMPAFRTPPTGNLR